MKKAKSSKKPASKSAKKTQFDSPFLNMIMLMMIIVLCIVGYMLTLKPHKYNKTNRVNSYEKCVAHGGRILETYPEKCITDDGTTFIRTVSEDGE